MQWVVIPSRNNENDLEMVTCIYINTTHTHTIYSMFNFNVSKNKINSYVLLQFKYKTYNFWCEAIFSASRITHKSYTFYTRQHKCLRDFSRRYTKLHNYLPLSHYLSRAHKFAVSYSVITQRSLSHSECLNKYLVKFISFCMTLYHIRDT